MAHSVSLIIHIKTKRSTSQSHWKTSRLKFFVLESLTLKELTRSSTGGDEVWLLVSREGRPSGFFFCKRSDCRVGKRGEACTLFLGLQIKK